MYQLKIIEYIKLNTANFNYTQRSSWTWL